MEQEQVVSREKEAESAKPNGSSKPNGRLKRVLQEAKIPEASDLSASIRALLEENIGPDEIVRILAQRGVTRAEVARVYAEMRRPAA